MGLAYQGDRDLILVLPEGTEQPTANRVAWIDTPVRLFVHGAQLAPWPVVVPSRTEVLAAYAKLGLRTRENHDLGDLAVHVAGLIRFADSHWALTPQHRGSYLSWHCRGRQVLRLRRGKGGVEVAAGVQYSAPTPDQPPPVTHLVTGPLALTELAEIEAAVAVAVRNRLNGADVTDREHALQAALGTAGAEALGLQEPLRREYPAWRPVDHPAFIDFLGFDGERFHVVETKLGNDAMLVLQALDYSTWVMAQREAIARSLGLRGVRHGVDIDLVVARPPGGSALGPYTLPQLEALDGGIRWQLHLAETEGATVAVTSEPPRRFPRSPAFGQQLDAPRHARRLQTHLLEHAELPADASPMRRTVEDNLLDGARERGGPWSPRDRRTATSPASGRRRRSRSTCSPRWTRQDALPC